ncbi:MAG TPA: branched-chain amino acid ABC transporter permease [Methanospirillum sp.]|uniref:branched-chain amino acid ABC transporter permease n=1 Tax=Methanospirillum sp. TaxID=45200 RepID=UPI002B8BAB8D|nr:branched-chain amino acid ABC transporter permease [Methanospirillum sp.]HOJ95608.1 branched-chain amino acid ABC transporter permease [Methanospirillum sp.]HPP78862.1 branched-chain amino acid ABC transporter permease [Methanospirillum sp.]
MIAVSVVKRYHLIPILAFTGAVFLPVLLGSNQYFRTVLILMLIFIIYASAWNFLTFSGQGSLGHAAFFGLGGYLSSLIAIQIKIPFIIAILAGAGLTTVIGLLIGLTCVRLREWFLAMVTFGFAVIVQTVIVISQLSPITGGWDGYPVPKLIPGTGPASSLIEYYCILIIAAGSLLLFHLLLRSKIGLALAAIRENEMEAKASGINTVPFKLFAFGISSGIAAIAGALEVSHFGYISPEIFGTDISFWPVVYSITGGLGTLAGPIIGTIVVSFIWEGLNALGLTYERFIVIGLLLILTIIFLPKGLVSLPDAVHAWKKRGFQMRKR